MNSLLAVIRSWAIGAIRCLGDELSDVTGRLTLDKPSAWVAHCASAQDKLLSPKRPLPSARVPSMPRLPDDRCLPDQQSTQQSPDPLLGRSSIVEPSGAGCCHG
jgi:hypothetical protein